jgi:DNA-binding MarR family transcriptional regulator
LSGTQTPGKQQASIPLKKMAELFDDATLKSSIRLLIVVSLALNKTMIFTELLELTGVGKGSLSNHLERLASAGYVRIRGVPTLKGPRTIVEITQKGIETYEKYLDAIRAIIGQGSPQEKQDSDIK